MSFCNLIDGMKKFATYSALFLICTFTNAQDQFTNTGNVQIFSGASVAFFGNFVNNGTFTDQGGVYFYGSASQIIAGSSPITFYNLQGNNALGVTMQRDIAVSNVLTLTAGPLILNGTTLTINNNASTAIARTTGYILSERTDNSSKIRWNIGANTSAHVFPFGTASGGYIPFTLTLTAGNVGNVTVSTFPTASNNTPFPSAPVAVTNLYRNGSDNSVNVVDRFWQIDKDGASGTATLRFDAAAAEVGTIIQLRAQRWNSSINAWDAPMAGQTSTATSATVSGVTTFSPWTLSGNNAPLPVELLSFSAETNDEGNVDLYWETSSERNNDYFAVQRSEDGVNFSEIGRVAGSGTSQTVNGYSYTDTDPLSGRSYYRLKQVDFDGVYKLSDILRVDMTGGIRLTAFPNPVKSDKFLLDFHARLESPTYISLHDRTGRIIYTGTAQAGVSNYEVNLKASPSSGVYLLRAVSKEVTLQKSVMIE
jgi:hypothetical protein